VSGPKFSPRSKNLLCSGTDRDCDSHRVCPCVVRICGRTPHLRDALEFSRLVAKTLAFTTGRSVPSAITIWQTWREIRPGNEPRAKFGIDAHRKTELGAPGPSPSSWFFFFARRSVVFTNLILVLFLGVPPPRSPLFGICTRKVQRPVWVLVDALTTGLDLPYEFRSFCIWGEATANVRLDFYERASWGNQCRPPITSSLRMK